MSFLPALYLELPALYLELPCSHRVVTAWQVKAVLLGLARRHSDRRLSDTPDAAVRTLTLALTLTLTLTLALTLALTLTQP